VTQTTQTPYAFPSLVVCFVLVQKARENVLG
jgi:hypothetical protein